MSQQSGSQTSIQRRTIGKRRKPQSKQGMGIERSQGEISMSEIPTMMDKRETMKKLAEAD